jgi:hypothetical protein
MPFGPARAGQNLLLNGLESRSRQGNTGGSIIDGDFASSAVTFNGKPAAKDWFAVSLRKPAAISRIIFAQGHIFHDGGWFDSSAGKPRIQIKRTKEGAWLDLCEIKDYPATTASDSAGLSEGQTFTCRLDSPVTIAAIRVIGKPASGDDAHQAFSSCAELQAF